MPTVLFTQENASDMAQRSVLARKLNPPIYKPRLAKLPPDERIKTAVQRQLSLVAEQIAHTRVLLNDMTYRFCEHCERGGIEPHHRAQLLKALDCLLDRQRKLLGIPDPANAKSQAPARSRSAPLPPPRPTATPPGPSPAG